MAVGHSTSNYDPHRRSTMFPGRELPPPVPTVATEANSRMIQYSSPDPYAQQPQPHYSQHRVNPSPFVQPPANNDVAHKVWMLNCKHCGKFITNRGMKCVLLLRPDVNLFSSDAMPVNCSVYQTSPHSPKTRTCECLSQTLCCHGCGTAIGYMIVAPCARCAPGMGLSPTSSHSLGQVHSNYHQPIPSRNTNGHRFVFHSTEVTYEERLYVAGEPDVNPDARSQEVFAAVAQQIQASPRAALPKIPRLRSGEILYWHHFARSGDMAGGVYDDIRARASHGYRFDPVNMARTNRIMACR